MPSAVKVVGTVTFDGAPLAGAQVTFYPTNSDTALTSQAMTDAAGRYELSTHVGGGKFSPGIAAGKYSIAITKLDTSSISSTLGPPKNVLPAKYADPKTSNLSADVADGSEKPFVFAITSK